LSLPAAGSSINSPKIGSPLARDSLRFDLVADKIFGDPLLFHAASFQELQSRFMESSRDSRIAHSSGQDTLEHKAIASITASNSHKFTAPASFLAGAKGAHPFVCPVHRFNLGSISFSVLNALNGLNEIMRNTSSPGKSRSNFLINFNIIYQRHRQRMRTSAEKLALE
jgi:hypothetical protein